MAEKKGPAVPLLGGGRNGRVGGPTKNAGRSNDASPLNTTSSLSEGKC